MESARPSPPRSRSLLLDRPSLRLRSARLLVAALAFASVSICSIARAQEVPPVSNPECVSIPGMPCSGGSSSSGSSSGSGTYSDPIAVWSERWHAWHEQHEARKHAREQAKEEAERRYQEQLRREAFTRDQAEQQAAHQRTVQYYAQQDRQWDEAQQQYLHNQAQRAQHAFNQHREDALGDLIDDGNPSALPSHVAAPTAAAPAAPTAWEASITDPALKPMARRLASVVPPLPIPPKEVSLDWKKVYLNDDRLMNATDIVVAGWEIAGTLGESAVLPCKVLLIGGKTFIAGENGAYLYLVEKDKDYDAAMAYLKDPRHASQFAHIVQTLREGRPLPPGTNLTMAQAARSIADPDLGDTGKMVWDAMTSRQALSAMVRKAAIEVGSDILTPSTETGLLEDEAERAAIFDTLRLERTRARKMLANAATSDLQRAQLTTLIHQSDKLSSELYKVDKFNHALAGVVNEKNGDSMSQMSDLIADRFLGPEAKGRQY